jgi:hypothetical protein
MKTQAVLGFGLTAAGWVAGLLFVVWCRWSIGVIARKRLRTLREILKVRRHGA